MLTAMCLIMTWLNSILNKVDETAKCGRPNTNFKRLESDVEVGNKMNGVLLKQAPSLERQC